MWPDSADPQLELQLAQTVLRSELLVAEDEEFINNFILTEEVPCLPTSQLCQCSACICWLQVETAGQAGSRSVLRDVLLFSGSLAAVAGAVFFFSERTRAAVTAAAVLPSALAAAHTVSLGAAAVQQSRSVVFG